MVMLRLFIGLNESAARGSSRQLNDTQECWCRTHFQFSLPTLGERVAGWRAGPPFAPLLLRPLHPFAVFGGEIFDFHNFLSAHLHPTLTSFSQCPILGV